MQITINKHILSKITNFLKTAIVKAHDSDTVKFDLMELKKQLIDKEFESLKTSLFSLLEKENMMLYNILKSFIK